eukprot:gene18037-21132_t
MLAKEVQIHGGAEGWEEYKKSLVQSQFYKFYLALQGDTLSADQGWKIQC